MQARKYEEINERQYCFKLTQYYHNILTNGTGLEQNVSESLTCTDSAFVHGYILIENQLQYPGCGICRLRGQNST